MRVTTEQIKAIKLLACRYFGEDAGLWLFGSRVDDKKRGGDYDFFIETNLIDANEIIERKIALIVALQDSVSFEDEKIDIVVKRRDSIFMVPIYEVAKNEGIQI